MSVWLIIISIQILLLAAWYRAAKFWNLLNQANTFLRKSKLLLIHHQFDEDAEGIIKDQHKYAEWKVDNFILIVLIWIVFTLLPVVGLSMIETGSSSYILNAIIAFLLAIIGYNWSLIKIRVDILNIECDYIDNLVNIVKGDETTFETDN